MPRPAVSSGVASFKTLKAWQHGQRLAIECVKAARGFPDYEQQALADRLRRAAYGIPLSIAAGTARWGTREYRQALDTARGALAEVESIIGVARELEYLAPADFGRLEALAIETGRMLYGLLRKVTGSGGVTEHRDGPARRPNYRSSN
jgi:four helix bundle protein